MLFLNLTQNYVTMKLLQLLGNVSETICVPSNFSIILINVWVENVIEDLLSFSTSKAVGKPIYPVLYQELPRALILSGIQVFSQHVKLSYL